MRVEPRPRAQKPSNAPPSSWIDETLNLLLSLVLNSWATDAQFHDSATGNRQWKSTGPMSSIILRSFNLVGPVINDDIDKNQIVNGRTDIADAHYKVIGDDLKSTVSRPAGMYVRFCAHQHPHLYTYRYISDHSPISPRRYSNGLMLVLISCLKQHHRK